jgi:hypothetical protein
MTPGERVLAAFEHVEPDRVTAWGSASPEFWGNAKCRFTAHSLTRYWFRSSFSVFWYFSNRAR